MTSSSLAEKVASNGLVSTRISFASTAASWDSETTTGTVEAGKQPQVPSSGFDADYELLDDVLGTGASGAVRRAICRTTGRRVAVKSFFKPEMSPKDLVLLESEVELHRSLVHQNLVHVEAVYETEEMTWLVMEELVGGELFEQLVRRRRFREVEAADIAWQVLRVLAFLHKQRIAHRDIKPENLVFVEEGTTFVKLIDFGFAMKVNDDGLSRGCGSLGYVAPEVLSGNSYDERCDLFSMGSLLYTMLTGRPLFEGNQDEVLRQTRRYRAPEFCMEFFCLPEEVQDLLRALLHADPARRLGAEQALRHPWFLAVAKKQAGKGAADDFVLQVLAVHRA